VLFYLYMRIWGKFCLVNPDVQYTSETDFCVLYGHICGHRPSRCNDPYTCSRIGNLQISLFLTLAFTRISSVPGFGICGDIVSSSITGKSPIMITSSSCSLPSTRKSPRITGSIRSEHPMRGGICPGKVSAGTNFPALLSNYPPPRFILS